MLGMGINLAVFDKTAGDGHRAQHPKDRQSVKICGLCMQTSATSQKSAYAHADFSLAPA